MVITTTQLEEGRRGRRRERNKKTTLKNLVRSSNFKYIINGIF